MAELSRQEMHRLARLGAQTRLEEIRREEAVIRRAFPELFNAATRPVPSSVGAQAAGSSDPDTAAGARSARRRGMSPAMRKEVSERMKRYWAARRSGAAKSVKANAKAAAKKGSKK